MKIRKFTLIAIAAISMALNSCQSDKEEKINPDEIDVSDTISPLGYRVKDNVLVFSSITSYEDAIAKNRKDKFEVEGKFEFQSLNKAISSGARIKASDIEDEFLRSILNSDGVVQIDKWLIKVDLSQEECRVLEVKNRTDKNYEDLVNNVDNSLVYHFPDNYNVLDYLEAGYTSIEIPSNPGGKVAILCGGGIGERDNTSPTNPRWINLYMRARNFYSKAGIYFTAEVHIRGENADSQAPYVRPLNTPCDGLVTFSYSFETNCKNSWGRNVPTTTGPFELACAGFSGQSFGNLPDHPKNQKIYEGSRGLKSLKISTRWNIHGYELQPADIL